MNQKITSTWWRKIVTAPKDGSDILVLENGRVFHVKWGGDVHKTWITMFGVGFVDYPTHWMPVPPLNE